MTFDIPPGTPKRECRSCHADIYWIVTEAGKKMPVNPDGTTHFGNCPQSKQWSGKSKAPDKLELARDVFRALADTPQIKLETLCHRFNTSDRSMRDAIRQCSILAAQPNDKGLPRQVIGYDPELDMIVMAQNEAQAERVIAHIESRAKSIYERTKPMKEAIKERFSKQENQTALFEAPRGKEEFRPL